MLEIVAWKQDRYLKVLEEKKCTRRSKISKNMKGGHMFGSQYAREDC